MIGTNEQVLLSSAYLPNIQYFSKLLSYNNCIIEVNDTYQKQSYRNRATIMGPNGLLDLVIPVKRPSGNRTITKDVLLDYDMPWQKTHWKAILSAYNHSPFFGIFEPELRPAFSRHFKYLIDFNFHLIDLILGMTDTQVQYKPSNVFINDPHVDDFRFSIHPKKRCQLPDPGFIQVPYFQVFEKNIGFISNLSFIDLLFNEGPQARFICCKCMKKGQP
jgi:hypothetical protein